MIKCVVFDVGGVLIKSRMEAVSENVGEELGINKSLLWDFWRSNKDSLAKGEQKVKDYCNRLDEKFGVKNSFEKYLSVWCKLEKTELNKECVTLIKTLKRKYKIGLISVVADAFAETDWSRDLYSIFDICILSCEGGFSKSESGLYKTFLEKSKLKPEECVVIDDREPPLKIAKSIGFKTILFENNEKLKKDLEKFGVKN